MKRFRRKTGPPPSPAEVDIYGAVQNGERCLVALRLLARALGEASSERLQQQSPAIERVRRRVGLLADELQHVRTWALEAEHFVKHPHPIPPSFMEEPEALAEPSEPNP